MKKRLLPLMLITSLLLTSCGSSISLTKETSNETKNKSSKGDSPFDWIRKNYGQSSETQALIGVFEVSVTGGHVDEYYGCYWWD